MESALKFISVILVLASAVSCDESLVQRKSVGYDILTFAQSWPQTSCLNINHLWEKADDECSPCRMPDDPNKWTIHGLWPSNTHGQHPSKCSNTKFNKKLLGPELEAKLKQQWPTMNFKFTLQAFWSYEWSKHGTCAADLESTNSVVKYFSKSLELNERYELGSILAEKNIVPGYAYDFNQFYSAISDSLGANVILQCNRNSVSKQQYVSQVIICFNKSFELIDCAEDGKNISNCKRSNDIIYPINPKSC